MFDAISPQELSAVARKNQVASFPDDFLNRQGTAEYLEFAKCKLSWSM